MTEDMVRLVVVLFLILEVVGMFVVAIYFRSGEFDDF